MGFELRPFHSLGHGEHSWLDAHHHFSFADYYDPDRMGWGDLIVWNDDVVQPRSGFPFHPHQNMEIITYVYKGAVTHQDHMGNHGRTEAGDVQVMSAGIGVVHGEYNREADIETRLFQIWILPDRDGHKPSWGSREFPKGRRSGQFVVLASGFTEDQKAQDALPINTMSRVAGATLTAGQSTTYNLGADRFAYLVPARGIVEVNGQRVNARDGLAIKDTEELHFNDIEDAEIVIVDTFDSHRNIYEMDDE